MPSAPGEVLFAELSYSVVQATELGAYLLFKEEFPVVCVYRELLAAAGGDQRAI